MRHSKCFRTTLSKKNTNWGSLNTNARNSEILLAEVITTRNEVFKVKSHTDIDSARWKGGLKRALRTITKSHLGKVGNLGGLNIKHTLISRMTKGLRTHLTPVMTERPEMWTFKVFTPRPLSRPNWRNWRIWGVSGDKGFQKLCSGSSGKFWPDCLVGSNLCSVVVF